LKSLAVKDIKYNDNILSLGSELEYNGDSIAKEKDVPKIIVLD